jgi:ribose-phosphate pyrophosphokinase
VVTNTVILSERAKACKKISQLSVSRVFGEAIRRIYNADSLSSLFV